MFRIILVYLTALCIFLATPAFSAEVFRLPEQESRLDLILKIYGNPVGFSVYFSNGKCMVSSPINSATTPLMDVNRSMTIFVEGEKNITIKCLPAAIELGRN